MSQCDTTSMQGQPHILNSSPQNKLSTVVPLLHTKKNKNPSPLNLVKPERAGGKARSVSGQREAFVYQTQKQRGRSVKLHPMPA